MESPSAQVRARILSQAGVLFVRHGYDGISMREIAEACTLSKAGIYYHFKDKEDLFLALLEENLDQVSRLLAEVRRENGSTRAQIERFALGLFERMDTDQRAVIRLANQEMSKLSPQVREKFGAQYQQKFIGLLVEMIAEGMHRGEIRTMDARICTWVLLGMLYPLFAPGSEPRSAGGDDPVSTALSIFFEGVNGQ